MLLKPARQTLVGVLLAATLPSACVDALDIEPAELDPQLDSGADARAPSLCEKYCSTVLSACTGEYAVYASSAICLKNCEALPAGNPGDVFGNTIHCRLHNAEKEPSEPETHCPIAGPGGSTRTGSGECGEDCESYCVLLMRHCARQFDERFDNLGHCRESCRSEIPNAGDFNIAIREGDSVQCRLYHTTVAAVDPDLHCGHATGTEPPCVADIPPPP
ncbi:MAG TPA: hypothetical protein VK524_28960 [Polyangiaceae bacterium]|nr:hypothetical protein [Polyangiaceae bacterium]